MIYNLYVVHYDLNGATAAFFVRAASESYAKVLVENLSNFKDQAKIISCTEVDMTVPGIIG
jgi:hypothetical protein